MPIEIDNVDKRILFELEKNARIPDSKLAKLVRKSKDSVRYRIKKLEENEIIKKYVTWIDYNKIGFRNSTIYLNVKNLPKEKGKLITEIKKDPRAYWVGVAEGVWNIGVTYFIRTNEELFNIKNELLSKYENLILDVKITSLAGVSVHEKTFLIDQESTFVTFSEKIEFLELDELSKKILKELYKNSRASLVDLSFKADTTIDIVRGRMNKLEKNGIITRYTIEIDYNKIGYELYKAFIYLNAFEKEELNALLKYAEKNNKIINVVKQIALWDFEFIMFVKNFQEYNQVLSDMTQKFPKLIKKIETAIMSVDIIFPCEKAGF